MLPAIPLVVIVLGACAYSASSKRDKSSDPGSMTQERALVFETALNEVKNPAKLRSLAEAFKSQGLLPQAELLTKRATLRELPANVKEERRAIFRKAMSSQDPQAVKTVAEAFEKQGATGAANALRKYAATIAHANS